MNKKTVKVIFVLIFFLASMVCFAADPAEGFWLSVDEKTGQVTAGWQIYVQGGKLYGRILSAADATPADKATDCKASYSGYPVAGNVSQMPIIGSIWIFGLTQDGKEGQWKGGNVIDPSDGKMYGCRITFHAAGGKFSVDTLEMRGTIGPLGRSQFWRKATEAQARGVR